ncbi:MAG: amidohydrolase family protein [Firmicutes bacterium]|nr:amidohydrolase family protein [Bacillota bacterium]
MGFDLMPLAIRLLNEYLGLSPMEALQGATKHAAEALGLPDVGTIAPGSKADILIVEGNPLEDWQALERPVWVIKEGQILWAKGG